jgi:GWxTD domain-containing protein
LAENEEAPIGTARAQSDRMNLRAVCLLCTAAVAASSQSSPVTGAAPADPARPLSQKECKKKEAMLRRELAAPWKKWLNQDVVYIVTDEERAAFKALQTDEERQSFVEEFWLRRDPTPDTIENEFEDEHYRRIAYVNERYASGIPGWKTDRGRIYIVYGPPDDIESHTGGGETPYPSEDWRYRRIEGIGDNVAIEFVDPTKSGEYHLTMDPTEKNAPPGPMSERFGPSPGTHLPPPENRSDVRLEAFVGLVKPPVVRYTDLEEVISTPINYNMLPIQVRADYFRATDYTVLTPITISIRKADLQYRTKDGYAKGTVNIFAQIATMPRRVVSTFEGTMNVETSSELLNITKNGTATYQKTVPLPAGAYRLNVVAKDMVAGTITVYEMALNVPVYDSEKLASSSLILADLIEKVPSRGGAVPFVIGETKVRPRVSPTFSRSESLGIYTQLYNFAPDETTRKPNGSIEYEVVRSGTDEKVFDYTEDVAALPGASPQQVTIEKLFPLNKLTPGQYTLRLKVTDNIRNQVLTPEATFAVTP